MFLWGSVCVVLCLVALLFKLAFRYVICLTCLGPCGDSYGTAEMLAFLQPSLLFPSNDISWQSYAPCMLTDSLAFGLRPDAVLIPNQSEENVQFKSINYLTIQNQRVNKPEMLRSLSLRPYGRPYVLTAIVTA